MKNMIFLGTVFIKIKKNAAVWQDTGRTSQLHHNFFGILSEFCNVIVLQP
ncbi:hypothetical protein LZ3411_0181 [Levilactobacillus zymae]|uniref:Uncharacterized protein n=1 Tax=Levilactobacillus zymae TaxID=267363 RepID=A0A1Y6JVR8_9LACO|nr:hypothetical protein LZ3411_0181 [Levilactobacillus zymae]